MKPAPFDYFAARDVESAVAALAGAGSDAKLIAGGQSLVPMLNFRLLRPSLLVDINSIVDLAYIRDDGKDIRIGAMTRHRQLKESAFIATELPVLHEAMQHVAHLAIRNRGTIGGSLSHADPAAELPMMSLLFNAEFEIAAPAGRRAVPAADFFVGALTTSLEEAEMLVEVRIPKLRADVGWAFEEVARRSGDFAVACIAVVLERSADTIEDIRIAMTGVAQTPLRATIAERILNKGPLSEAAMNAAIEAIRAAIDPNTDLHASADYRRDVICNIARRAIDQSWQRAGNRIHD